MKKLFILLILITNSFAITETYCQKSNYKPRTIVTTDGEIDDVDSYIRMLLYANEFRIEGLVYSSSMWHYKGDGKGTRFVSEMEMTKTMYGEKTSLRWPGSSWMDPLLSAYGTIYPNLIKHDPTFPTPSYLKSIVRVGNIDFEGEMEKITEGSEYIKDKLLDNTTEPIYLQVWGGTNTIARALKSIEEKYKSTPQWAAIYKKVCDKAVIYAILDQDATYRKYIAPNWKDLKIFYNSNQFWCFAYPWQKAVPAPWKHYLEGPFMSKNIINDHGPLLKQYYSYGDGQKQEGDDEHLHGDLSVYKNPQWGSFNKYDFLSEGDSPSYLHLVNVGLDNLNNPHYGGWGGRLIQSATQPSRWEDGELAQDYNTYTDTLDKTYPQTRWIETLQNDFAARADWCISDYKNANHAPTVKLKSKSNITSVPGKTIKLKGQAKDPDGHKLNYRWWQYADVDTYSGKVQIENANTSSAKIAVPSDLKKGENIHIILEVSDNHEFPMTRYQRVVITGK